MALILGLNEPFRPAIEAASRRSGLDAPSLAALIDAEAVRISSGGDAGRWDPASRNERSGALGLTQFVAATWLTHARGTGHLLNRRARRSGLVTSRHAIVSGREDELLALRVDPLLSVVSAAEYGVANLARLRRAGVLPARLSDDQRAWFVYLCHHEGPSEAVAFLDGSRRYLAADLAFQLGAAEAERRLAGHGGDANAAYRAWLADYMDRMVVPARFRRAAPPAWWRGASLAVFR
jgi:hypothetical protein